jgi:hypothetical protein
VSNIITTTTSTNEIFPATNDLIEDIKRYDLCKQGLSVLRDSIAARIRDIIANSGVPQKAALADLTKQLVAAGVDRRRVSEILKDLGFVQRQASKKTAGKKAEKDAALLPVIEELVKIAQERAGEDAISALRRAYLTLQAKNNA